ncbi:MAG TPA: hypothetical protein VHB21_27235 [Minicystis sp.]|nr:hypothetical protein [Minicystis sp.]
MPKLVFRRGTRRPRAIAWFGVRSFWGHLWHLAASVVATEDIDSRDWMVPDAPGALTARAARVLGAAAEGPSLTEALGRDVWVDFVADTGDDAAVSFAVAKMLFATYAVEDPEHPGRALTLPRGDLLVFGGDTAYPVATELEIMRRVVVPFNAALRKTGDHGERPRVLLGVPGNHDWYAGLDGFGRMFRARRGQVGRASRDEAAGDEHVPGNLRHFFHWMEAFRVGSFVAKRPTLPLVGYEPVQSASYFALRLAPGLDLFGADRQLRSVDFQQRLYFAEARSASSDKRPRGLLLVMADPAYAFLSPSAAGQEILRALDVDLGRDAPLVLSGDTHHYCRQSFGRAVHVTAGGGGAFLHPAPIRRAHLPAPDAEFPGPRASLALALQIPLQLAHGRAGLLGHAALALLYLPTFATELAEGASSAGAAGATGVVAAVVCALLGGFRARHAAGVVGLAAATGATLGALPLLAQALEEPLAGVIGFRPYGPLGVVLPYALAVYAGAWVLGAFFMALTVLGLEMHQAFGALAHPGYKHVVRLRVRRDGTRVDGWVLGQVDPLAKGEPVVLVDRFTWENPAAGAPAGRTS